MKYMLIIDVYVSKSRMLQEAENNFFLFQKEPDLIPGHSNS